jgi:hypothetical protein
MDNLVEDTKKLDRNVRVSKKFYALFPKNVTTAIEQLIAKHDFTSLGGTKVSTVSRIQEVGTLYWFTIEVKATSLWGSGRMVSRPGLRQSPAIRLGQPV